MSKTILLHCQNGDVIVSLFEGSTCIGAWRNCDDNMAADIAAEVLKVALPETNVIPFGVNPGDADIAGAWWSGIKTFDGVLKEFGNANP